MLDPQEDVDRHPDAEDDELLRVLLHELAELLVARLGVRLLPLDVELLLDAIDAILGALEQRSRDLAHLGLDCMRRNATQRDVSALLERSEARFGAWQASSNVRGSPLAPHRDREYRPRRDTWRRALVLSLLAGRSSGFARPQDGERGREEADATSVAVVVGGGEGDMKQQRCCCGARTRSECVVARGTRGALILPSYQALSLSLSH